MNSRLLFPDLNGMHGFGLAVAAILNRSEIDSYVARIGDQVRDLIGRRHLTPEQAQQQLAALVEEVLQGGATHGY